MTKSKKGRKRRKKSRKKRGGGKRRKTRKQRGGGWRQVWPGGPPDTLAEAIALLNNIPPSQRIRISLPEEDWNEKRSSNAEPNRGTGGLGTDPLTTPLEFNAKEGLEDGEETAESGAVAREFETDPRVAPWAVAAMRYLIYFHGAEDRAGGIDEHGALVDYPFTPLNI